MCDVDDDRHMKQDEEKKIPVIPYYLLYIYGVCYFICEYKVKCKCIVLPKKMWILSIIKGQRYNDEFFFSYMNNPYEWWINIDYDDDDDI